MVVAASPETYFHVIEYGLKKTNLRYDRLLMQAFMAGVYVGMAGHCCSCLAGGYSTDPNDPLAIAKSSQKFLYASMFPVAFIAIIMTGAELFTGNTMTMLICALERKIKIMDLVINWICSLVGNWAGALFAAYFLSYLTGAVTTGHVKHYFDQTAIDKTSHDFIGCFFRGVGCNTFVCLAVWFVVASDDAAGKIMSLWFPVVGFCIGGYEHIIANFYTLQTALLIGAPVSLADVIVKNFIPTLLGNLVGGCGLVGAVYWFNFYPTLIPTNTELQNFEGSQCSNPLSNPLKGFEGSNFDADLPVKQRFKNSIINENGIVIPKETFGGDFLVHQRANNIYFRNKDESNPSKQASQVIISELVVDEPTSSVVNVPKPTVSKGATDTEITSVNANEQSSMF